jgi:hypothetical protein
MLATAPITAATSRAVAASTIAVLVAIPRSSLAVRISQLYFPKDIGVSD